MATLVYAIVHSRIDYCNTVLVGAPRTVTDKLQCVLNAAAHIISSTRKFDCGLGQILHDELHWLDFPDRVFFKLAVIVSRRLNGRAPLYLADYCVPADGADTDGCWAFSIAGPTIWNSLPVIIRDPTVCADCFRRLFKTYLLLDTSALNVLEVL